MEFNLLKNIRFKNKLLLFVIIIIFIPMILLQRMYFKSTTSLIEYNSIKSSQDILRILENRIDVVFKNTEKQSRAFLYNTVLNDILSMVNKDEEKPYYTDIDFIIKMTNVTNSFRNICLSDNSVQSVGIITPDKMVYDYNFNPASFNINSDVDVNDIIASINQNNGQPIWYFNAGTGHMLYIRSIDDLVNFETLGYMVMAINNYTINSLIKGWNPQTYSSIKLLYNDIPWISSEREHMPHSYRDPLLLQTKKDGYQISKKDDLFTCYTQQSPQGWRILVSRPYHTVIGDTKEVAKNILVAILVILAISIIFIIILNRDFVKPLNIISMAMKRFEKTGEYEFLLLDRGDELGYLAHSYNSMSNNLDLLIKRVYKEQLTRKEAELKALQSQINPHFLFNTLQSINIMAQLHNAEPVSDCIIALSSLLEAGMGKKESKVTLASELEYINNYIFIMQQRSIVPIIIKKNVSEEYMDYKIPVLLLQPIVENSVLHCVHKDNSKLFISINIFAKDDNLHFEITDNGGGISPDRLQTLNELLTVSVKNFNEVKKKSIGIENVNKRLILYYGESCRLYIDSKFGFYTKISFSIPIEKNIESNKIYNNQEIQIQKSKL